MPNWMRLVALVFLALVTLTPLVEADTIISAPIETVVVGHIFTIPISITDAVDLTSWQLDLAFDPAIVKATVVTEGQFMLSFGTTLFTPGVIDNMLGLISLVADSYVDLPPNPSGSGVLANIDFLALAPGVSQLILSNVFLNFSDQGFGIENGQITAVPEPATFVLLAMGLVLVCARGLASNGEKIFSR